MKDKRDININIGDVVAFTLPKYRGNTPLQLGIVGGFSKGLIEVKLENGRIVHKRPNSLVVCAHD